MNFRIWLYVLFKDVSISLDLEQLEHLSLKGEIPSISSPTPLQMHPWMFFFFLESFVYPTDISWASAILNSENGVVDKEDTMASSMEVQV